MEGKVNQRILTRINNRRLSIIVFSLFSSWMLAFPFEGRILYELMSFHNISSNSFIFSTMVAHFLGLLLSWTFVKTMRAAKKFILFSVAFCIIASCIFFFEPSFLWRAALLVAAFLIGCCVAAWSFFLKGFTPKNDRIKTIADGLIGSNILMILLNMSAIHVSPYAGLGFSIVALGMAFLFGLKLPTEENSDSPLISQLKEVHVDKYGSLIFLCLFIVIITINSGLMYHVQGPAFAHLEWLTSWYWAIPYIIALFIMRNLPRKTNRSYILYVAIAMIGFSFIAFMALDRSWMSYLIVNTLMLGASGVFDLFWWSILGEALEFDKNPAKIMGIGLSSNVLGVMLGGVIGSVINRQSLDATLLALGVVCITLIMLPPLHKRLTALLIDHVYLTAISEIPPQEQIQMDSYITLEDKLTERESEITTLLLKGKTYRMIAEELHVSQNTVKTHIKNIYSKAEVQSRSELMNLLLDKELSSKEPANT